jgi:hypothetical protein
MQHHLESVSTPNEPLRTTLLKERMPKDSHFEHHVSPATARLRKAKIRKKQVRARAAWKKPKLLNQANAHWKSSKKDALDVPAKGFVSKPRRKVIKKHAHTVEHASKPRHKVIKKHAHMVEHKNISK